MTPQHEPHLTYALADGVEVSADREAVVAASAFSALTMSGLSPAARGEMLALAEHPRTESEFDATIAAADGTGALSRFYYYLSMLAKNRMVRLQTGGHNGEAPLAVLTAISPYFQHRRIQIEPEQPYRLSRFAYLRRSEDGALVVESPLSHARLRLGRPIAAALLEVLAAGTSSRGLARSLALDEGECLSFVALLAGGRFADRVDDRGQCAEDGDATLMQWDFHDLLFHARSRMGRHDGPLGGRFRFLGKLPPQPAVKTAKEGAWVLPLPTPDLDRVRAVEPSLEAVMAARTSVRRLQAPPITWSDVGEFLYRVARVKSRFRVDDKGEFTSRPYPSGGASYELELYLTVDQCMGIPPGMYWYDPVQHALCLLRAPDDLTRALLRDAHTATAGLAWPQILITVAARFQRVSWKYDAMAYATILKNTGVLYATMYLVATAMGLGPCGVGLGDSDRFALAAGTDYYQETSVGEFILSSGRGR